MSNNEHPLQMEREEHEHNLFAKRITLVGTSGNKVDVTSDNKLKVDASVTASINEFNTNDIEQPTNTLTYIGLENSVADWWVKKIDTSSDVVFTHASELNNSSVTAYSTAWASRASLTYGIYSSAF